VHARRFAASHFNDERRLMNGTIVQLVVNRLGVAGLTLLAISVVFFAITSLQLDDAALGIALAIYLCHSRAAELRSQGMPLRLIEGDVA
jgi:hypothetical protein